MSWTAYEFGSTIGKPGSEFGTIVCDDEHRLGARITLERDCASAPWTITCGMYGWFFHTRFLNEEEAVRDFPRMKDAIDRIFAQVPDKGDVEAEAKFAPVYAAINQFVTDFP